jgi:SAM-dependent methyltransferase
VSAAAVDRIDSHVSPAAPAPVEPPEWRRPRLYEWYFSSTPYGRAMRTREERVVFGALDGVLRADQRVLELGPGTGHYTLRLARNVREVVGLDASPAMVEFLATRVRREGVTNVVAERGVVPQAYGGPDGFDGVLAVGVLNYVPHLGDALRWIRERVRPGGFAVFTVPVEGPTGQLSRLTAHLSRKRVYPTSTADVRRALATAGLELRQAAGAGIGGRERTLVVHAAAPA